ncbi:MAG TPA: hypothetical protein VG935_04730 [Patescibacteria group bacterium]|nr:hypothetical protein [Patescibacteria group bacterium]
MEKEYSFNDKTIRIRKRGNTGFVTADNGFTASFDQLQTLSLYCKYADYTLAGNKVNKSATTMKMHMENMRIANTQEGVKPTTTELAVQAEIYGLLYPLTITGIRAILDEDLGSPLTRARAKFVRSQTRLYREGQS